MSKLVTTATGPVVVVAHAASLDAAAVPRRAAAAPRLDAAARLAKTVIPAASLDAAAVPRRAAAAAAAGEQTHTKKSTFEKTS
jgi:hypothetical protein